MIYDLYGAYNCPNDKVIYIFYELTTKVVLFFLVFHLFNKKSKNLIIQMIV